MAIDRIWSELRHRWRALVGRDRAEVDLDDELRLHLELEARKLEQRGMSPADAHRAAHVAFGGLEAIKDEARGARGTLAAEQCWADLRYAVRSVMAQRAFAIGVIGTLALGIGANVTVFGIVDRLMFRTPSALLHADRVHRVHLTWTQDGQRRRERHVQVPRLVDFERELRHVDLVAGFQVRQAALERGDQTREGRVAVVSASFLQFFDAPPALGRWFTAADDAAPEGRPVVVLGHAHWLTRYGGREDVLGQSLQVDRLDATIVGVAPRGFVGVTDGEPPAVFIPMRAFGSATRGPGFATSYNWSWLELLVRRKPGASTTVVDADVTNAFRASWAAENQARGEPDDVGLHDPSASVGPLHLGRGPDAELDSKVALWMTGVALVVFLIACANVANLFLARAVARQRDMALRLALGVGRGRLARQLLLECLVLGAAGGGVGALLAWTLGGTLRAVLLPVGVTASVVTDARTLAFTAALAVVAGTLTVVVPALIAAKLDIGAALKSGGRGASRPRTRTQAALVVIQAALSVVLLVSAGAFVVSLRRAEAHRLGFDVDRLVYAEVNLRGTRLDESEMAAVATRLEETARGVPGVVATTMTASVPFWSNEGRGFAVPGVENVRERGRFTMQAGSADYFTTTGTRIVRGRGFTSADTIGGMLVVVVSEGMARVLWPDRDAIGQCVQMLSGPPPSGAVASDAPCRTVVGVAEESAMVSLEPSREFAYYLPVAQYPEGASPQFFIRTAGSPEAAAASLRARLQAVLPGAAYVNVVPLSTLVAPEYRAWRFGATVFVAFGLLALAVAALGLHSLVAYEVAQREQEFGVRVAMGASQRQVLRLVLARGARLVGGGIAVGVALALALSSPLDGLMFHQSTRDPLLLAVVTVVLSLAAVAASIAPALRATRVDPTEALRAE